jgi:8-hydroxy-5-deazaflavin:NADPH oxidoreductase
VRYRLLGLDDLSEDVAVDKPDVGVRMKIAVLGTGTVGQAIAGRLALLGHDVVIGTRDVDQTLARTEPDAMGHPPYATWQQAHPAVQLVPFPEAGEHGELVVNATSGASSLAALDAAGAANLAGKVILDLALPLDFSQGMPPLLTVANTDSLGEQIQRGFPAARVVKTLNTVLFDVMIDPARIPGRHNIFLAGDDISAKKTVTGLLREFGWPEEAVIDLGGIRAARGTEMYMQLYFTLAGALSTFDFNIAVVRRDGSLPVPGQRWWCSRSPPRRAGSRPPARAAAAPTCDAEQGSSPLPRAATHGTAGPSCWRPECSTTSRTSPAGNSTSAAACSGASPVTGTRIAAGTSWWPGTPTPPLARQCNCTA